MEPGLILQALIVTGAMLSRNPFLQDGNNDDGISPDSHPG